MAITLKGISKSGGRMQGTFESVKDAELTATSVIEYQTNNPKRTGSKAAERFASYVGFKGTVTDLLTKTECTTGDLKYDLSNGLCRIVNDTKSVTNK